jgi:hypothetical protein
MLAQIEKIKVDTTPNQKPSVQVGNYCWLIAGAEMLLSCKFFVKFIYFYTPQMGAEDSENIYPMCFLLREYGQKNNVQRLYGPMEKIIFDSLDIKDFHQAEDMNVIFLYMSKSKIYGQFFSEFTYVGREPIVFEKKYTVLAFPASVSLASRSQRVASIGIDASSPIDVSIEMGVPGLYSFAIKSGGHWEIYQRYLDSAGKSFFMPKNTNYLLGQKWEILVVFCCNPEAVIEKFLAQVG